MSEEHQFQNLWFEVRKEPIQGDQVVVGNMHETIRKNLEFKDSLYIYSNSYSALCCFFIFAFGKEKNIKIADKMFKLVEKEQRQKVEKNCFQIFSINLEKDTPLIYNLGKIQNKLNFNKILLQQASQGLNEKDSISGVRSLANNIPLRSYECNQSKTSPIINKESKNAIVIGKNKQKPFLFIFSQFQPQVQKDEESSSILKSSKSQKYNLQRISLTSSEDAEDEEKKPNKNNKKGKGKGKQSKSQIKEKKIEQVPSKLQNSKAPESNQFTWFQGIILTIIILSLLSHFFGIFDQQINEYNEKNNRQYYLIQTGYTIVNFISMLSEKIFS